MPPLMVKPLIVMRWELLMSNTSLSSGIDGVGSLMVAPGRARSARLSNPLIVTASLHAPETIRVFGPAGLSSFKALLIVVGGIVPPQRTLRFTPCAVKDRTSKHPNAVTMGVKRRIRIGMVNLS